MVTLEAKTITSIKTQNRNPSRVSVFLDGSFWLGLDKELALELNLKKGRKLTPKELENIVFQKERKKALRRALRLLSCRPRSEQEIKTRLEKTNFSQPTIKSVLTELKRMNYLNDKEFARMWVKDRSGVKKYGPTRVKMELFQKGLDHNTVEQALEEHYPSNEESLALELAQNKVRSYTGLDFPTAYRRLSGYLKRRGFSSSTIRQVCQKVLRDLPFY